MLAEQVAEAENTFEDTSNILNLQERVTRRKSFGVHALLD